MENEEKSEEQVSNKKGLDHYRELYEKFTAKASEVNRQLALAGIGVIWIFRNSDQIAPLFPQSLLLPLSLLVLSLGLDLLQYLFGSIIWGLFFHIVEDKVHKSKIPDPMDITAPLVFPIIIWVLFFLKILAMVFSYFLLIRFFLPQLF